MSASRLIFLNIGDLEELLGEFVDKYGFSTAEFLCKETLRRSVSEDDDLQWEALISMKQELEQTHKEMRRQYLSDLHDPVTTAQAPSLEEDQVRLAA